MGLEVTAIPLALLAGVVGVLSPCVWPLVPVVMSSAAVSGRSGPLWLAGGMSLSFAVTGTALTFVLVQAGLDPELFRYVAAVVLIAAAGVILVPYLNDLASRALSSGVARMGLGDAGAGGGTGGTPAGQFGMGALLGVVWLPCVGPTLGAAIALASMGQNMSMAFAVMLTYGVGTAGVLLAAGIASESALRRWRGGGLRGGEWGTRVLGGTLLVLGAAVLTGVDKWVETQAVDLLPGWVFMI